MEESKAGCCKSVLLLWCRLPPAIPAKNLPDSAHVFWHATWSELEQACTGFPCSALNSSCGKPLTLLHLVSNLNAFYISIYYVWTLKISTRGGFFPTIKSTCSTVNLQKAKIWYKLPPLLPRPVEAEDTQEGRVAANTGLSLPPWTQAPSGVLLRETFITTRRFVRKAILTSLKFSVKVFQLRGRKLPQRNFHFRCFFQFWTFKDSFSMFYRMCFIFLLFAFFFYIFHSMLVKVICNKLPSVGPIMNQFGNQLDFEKKKLLL